MAGNTSPQFCRNGNIGACALTAPNGASDGSGTIGVDIFLAFAADPLNGSLVEYVRFVPTATAAASTTAAIGRVFASSATAGVVNVANTHLLGEVVLRAEALLGASPITWIELPVNLRLPAGWTILVTTDVAPAASTAWKAVTVGGDY